MAIVNREGGVSHAEKEKAESRAAKDCETNKDSSCWRFWCAIQYQPMNHLLQLYFANTMAPFRQSGIFPLHTFRTKCLKRLLPALGRFASGDSSSPRKRSPLHPYNKHDHKITSNPVLHHKAVPQQGKNKQTNKQTNKRKSPKPRRVARPKACGTAAS